MAPDCQDPDQLLITYAVSSDLVSADSVSVASVP